MEAKCLHHISFSKKRKEKVSETTGEVKMLKLRKHYARMEVNKRYKLPQVGRKVNK